jgi:hypothetical protein
MSIGAIKQIQNSVLNPEGTWDWTVQQDISDIKPPDMFMGARRNMMHGEIIREWSKWIIEQFIDEKYISKNIGFTFIFKDVYTTLSSLVGMQVTDCEKKEIAKTISQIVIQRIEQIIALKERRLGISMRTKQDLLSIYGPKPRCWLTGHQFSDEAIHNYTARKSEYRAIKLPTFIDRFKPMGLCARDLSIEIDHLYPYSLGGADEIDNFRLICGWANKVKSNHISAYSVGTRANISDNLFPRKYYYWVVRLIGMRRKCEIQGCSNNIDNSELTVRSSLGNSKIITPISMQVVCQQHASSLVGRYVNRSAFE